MADNLRPDHHRHGRGGRHARARARAVRQAHPAARTRRVAAARQAELERGGRLRRQPLRLQGVLGRQERQAVSAGRALLRRRRDEDVRRRALSPARARLRRAAAPGRDLSRLADLVRRHGAVLHAGRRTCIRFTARAARTRPSRPPAAPIRGRRSLTSRASSSCTTTSPGPATGRSTRRAASCSTKSNMPFSKCIRCMDCDGFPCLVHAKSDAEVIAIRPALKFPNVTLLTNARAMRLDDEPRRHRGHRSGRRTRRRDRDLPRRDRRGLLRRRQLGPAAARVRKRQAPARAGQRVGPGGTQLHVPQQHRGARGLEGAEPDPLPEDAGAQRLLLQRAGLRFPARRPADGRQVAGADVPGRKAHRQAGPDVLARRAGQARRRLLAVAPRICRGRTTA